MVIHVMESKEIASDLAANKIAQQLERKKNTVLGLATGSTPQLLYRNLIAKYQTNQISFQDVIAINLDEYVGLDGSHPQSYRYFMDTELFNHVDIKKENTHVPNGMAEDLDEECKRFNELIKSYDYPDIQVLGVGQNGHIGFNEPNDRMFVHTHVEPLTENTIKVNGRFFEDKNEMPRTAISLGMKNILCAKHIILLAFGKEKADAVAMLEDDRFSTACPVSLLKLHRNVDVIVDREAASKLQHA